MTKLTFGLKSIFAASGLTILLFLIIEIAFWILVGTGTLKWLKGIRGIKNGKNN